MWHPESYFSMKRSLISRPPWVLAFVEAIHICSDDGLAFFRRPGPHCYAKVVSGERLCIPGPVAYRSIILVLMVANSSLQYNELQYRMDSFPADDN